MGRLFSDRLGLSFPHAHQAIIPVVELTTISRHYEVEILQIQILVVSWTGGNRMALSLGALTKNKQPQEPILYRLLIPHTYFFFVPADNEYFYVVMYTAVQGR